MWDPVAGPPRLHGFDKPQELTDALVAVGCQYAQTHQSEFRPDLDLPATMWLVVETALRVSFQYVLQPKPPMPQQQFRAALVDMLARFCLPDPTFEQRPQRPDMLPSIPTDE
jgi:hypothetical protein